MPHFIHTDGYAYITPDGILSTPDQGVSYDTMDYTGSGSGDQILADGAAAGLFWRIVNGTPVQDAPLPANTLYGFAQLRGYADSALEFQLTATDTNLSSDLYGFAAYGWDIALDQSNYTTDPVGSWFDYATGPGHAGSTPDLSSFWYPYLVDDSLHWRIFFHSGSDGSKFDCSCIGFRYAPEIVSHPWSVGRRG